MTTHAATINNRATTPPRPPAEALTEKSQGQRSRRKRQQRTRPQIKQCQPQPVQTAGGMADCFRAMYPKMVTPIGVARSSIRIGDSNAKRRLTLRVIHKVITQSVRMMIRKNGPAQMAPARAVFDNRGAAAGRAGRPPSRYLPPVCHWQRAAPSEQMLHARRVYSTQPAAQMPIGRPMKKPMAGERTTDKMPATIASQYIWSRFIFTAATIIKTPGRNVTRKKETIVAIIRNMSMPLRVGVAVPGPTDILAKSAQRAINGTERPVRIPTMSIPIAGPLSCRRACRSMAAALAAAAGVSLAPPVPGDGGRGALVRHRCIRGARGTRRHVDRVGGCAREAERSRAGSFSRGIVSLHRMKNIIAIVAREKPITSATSISPGCSPCPRKLPRAKSKTNGEKMAPASAKVVR